MSKERSMDPITCAIVSQMQKHHELQLTFKAWKTGVVFGRQQRKFDETESSYLYELCSDNSMDLEYRAFQLSRRDAATFWRLRHHLRNKLTWCCDGPRITDREVDMLFKQAAKKMVDDELTRDAEEIRNALHRSRATIAELKALLEVEGMISP